MKPRPKRTTTELREASEHVHYELWMLDRTAAVLATGAFANSLMANALLEAFAIHARSLRDFFYSEQGRPDDILATDYFDDATAWGRICGEEPSRLTEAMRRVSLEVAHLTYARLAVLPEDKGWHPASIVEGLRSIAQRFAATVPSDRLKGAWRAEPDVGVAAPDV